MAFPGFKRSIVVGIGGGSAAGKSTFAAALVQALQAGASPASKEGSVPDGLAVEVLSMDRYFTRDRVSAPTFVSPSTREEQFHANHPDSADNARLVADLDARRKAEDAPDVVIVEGLMALQVPIIRERLDLRLFIELDADERALRRLLRSMNSGRGNADPAAIVTYYRECARVGHALYVEPSRVHADLILRGDGDFTRTASLIAALIRASLNDSE